MPGMDHPAAPSPRAVAIDLRWLLPVLAGGLFALLLIAASPVPFPSASLFLSQQPSPASMPTRASSRRGSGNGTPPPLFVDAELSAQARPRAQAAAAASPPRFAYLISGTTGDAGMLRRVLMALYHPRNHYILHLDAEAPDSDRAELAAFVAAHPVLAAARNVRVVEKANLVTYRGPTMVTTTLHAAAAFLWGEGRGRGADWDWFINLSASDYPLVTQDDMMDVFSKLPRDLNFIDHTSDIGWKAFARAMPVIIDPALYMKAKGDLFWIPQRRELPTAFKLFGGSAWMVLSRPFVEYLIWGWDNLPRTVLMYYANFISSPEGYFHTVACNADEFRNTTVNSDLHYIAWDNPPMQHPHLLTHADWDGMVASAAPFARKFRRNDPVLDRIDDVLLSRGPGMLAPGGWCAGEVRLAGSYNRSGEGGGGAGGEDPCKAVGNAAYVRPGPGAERLRSLMASLLSEENFRPKQCIVVDEQNAQKNVTEIGGQKNTTEIGGRA